jgi:hypothetical protein
MLGYQVLRKEMITRLLQPVTQYHQIGQAGGKSMLALLGAAHSPYSTE